MLGLWWLCILSGLLRHPLSVASARVMVPILRYSCTVSGLQNRVISGHLGVPSFYLGPLYVLVGVVAPTQASFGS